ncbi:MAG: universal stress protein [Mucilaginibacter sp.]|uniref:universal stress protein n=1 Tax=Mucilaginibacter sp. TaxID=1882438 RepID=UPI003264DB81
MKYSIKNILVPTDFSETADNALRVALAIGERHGATVHLINIVTTHLLLPSMASVSGAGDEMAMLISSSKEELESYRLRAINEGQRGLVAVSEFGTVSSNAAAYVANHHIDLVVMGTHGTSGWKEFFIGSNAMATIRECDCPVLAVPLSFSKSSFDKVLYPIRNVFGVASKYDYVRGIIEKNDSEVHLLGLVQKKDINDIDLLDTLKQVRDMVIRDKDVITFETFVCENLADKILKTAHERKDDLMVINATLDTGWKEYFMGDFTQQIINHSRIPVLAVRL